MITRGLPHWACTATIEAKKKEESASKPKELDLDAETDDDGAKGDRAPLNSLSFLKL